jgi:hypothetical protein
MRASLWVAGAAAIAITSLLAGTASAEVIGLDTFSYPDGSIGYLTGGVGWSRNSASPSVWNGFATVTGGALFTAWGNTALRDYGNPTLTGAIQATGQVYYGASVAITGAPQWGGMSSFDNGAERVFFGVPWQTNQFGIDIVGVGVTTSSLADPPGNYYLVSAIDYLNHQVRLRVNPDYADFDDPATAATSADLAVPYTASNWSTSIRLGSGNDGSVGAMTWDNLRVATTFAEALPEPGSGLLVALGAAALLRRRR